MSNMEVMYYQVKVPEEQGSVLRFLWQEDGNVGCDLLDLEMCVYVFGGTFSSGCCNYALQKTAVKQVISDPKSTFWNFLN